MKEFFIIEHNEVTKVSEDEHKDWMSKHANDYKLGPDRTSTDTIVTTTFTGTSENGKGLFDIYVREPATIYSEQEVAAKQGNEFAFTDYDQHYSAETWEEARKAHGDIVRGESW